MVLGLENHMTMYNKFTMYTLYIMCMVSTIETGFGQAAYIWGEPERAPHNGTALRECDIYVYIYIYMVQWSHSVYMLF